ncbi:MAG: hypothetical protein LLF95_08160 [Bacteroidales bacterium]|nr:hypothetical protein [Bacteroidales bacterium]
MDTYNLLPEMYSRRKNLLASHTNIIRDDEDLLPASKRAELCQYALHNEMSIALIDLHNSRYSFLTSNLKHCLPAITIRTDVWDNWDDLFWLVHPDDRYFYCESDCLGYEYLMQTAPELRYLFESNYIIRLKEKDKAYGVYLIRIYVWVSDEWNNPRLLICECRQLLFCRVVDFTLHRTFCILSEDKRQVRLYFETSNHDKLLQSLMDTFKYYNKNGRIKETAQITHKGYQTFRNNCSRNYKRLNVDNMADACQMARLLRFI